MTSDPDNHTSRFGVTLPASMIEQLDEILIHRGYTSRSKGIHDAIQFFNINNQWFDNRTNDKMGVITILYDCKKENLLTSIYEIRYEYQDIIRISLRKNISQDRQLDLFVIQGSTVQIKALVKMLTSLNGIETVKITTIPIGDPLLKRVQPSHQ
ncbi:MAG: nickel-responsive transcriptional regulator NikR [Methanoregula sp.]|nr:nickel-responsive transcriptional regulator NikR [Methanoregula sp.]